MTGERAPRWYRACLRLLPRAFRDDVQAELEAAYTASADIARRRFGVAGRPYAWWRGLVDIAAAAIGLRWRGLPSLERVPESTRRTAIWSDLGDDVRLALRRLRRAPAFAGGAIGTLALGIGATVTVFTLFSSVLLQPLAYREPERLVAIFLHEVARGAPRSPTSPFNYLAWRDAAAAVELLTAAHPWSPSLTGRERPDEVLALKATPSLFTLLGVPPLIGRTFDSDDERRGDTRRVVLGYDLWQRRFGGDRSIVGQPLVLDGEPYEVIGVMPRGFRFPPFWFAEAEMWAPLELSGAAAEDHARYLRVFGRLARGRTLADARAELETVGARLVADHPDANEGTTVNVEMLNEPVVSRIRPTLVLVFVAVLLLALVACANVANLQVVHVAGRRQTLAIQTALGASVWRLRRQQLVESAVLACVSAAAGTVLARWGVAAVVQLAPANLPRLQEISMDARSLAFAVGAAAVVAVVLGLVATVRAPEASLALHGAGERATDARRVRLRSALVVWQVAGSVVLLVAAGLVARSLWHLHMLDPGFRRDDLLTMTVKFGGTPHATPERQPAFVESLLETVRAVPGVEEAALVNFLPIGGDDWGISFALEGTPAVKEARRPRAVFRVASPAYARAMGVPLVAGRDFNGRDTSESPGVVLVNRTLAAAFATPESIVGRRVQIGSQADPGPWLTIVGVVGDMRQRDLADAVPAELYFPYAQNPAASYTNATLVVHARRPPDALRRDVERAVWSKVGALPLTNVRTMVEILATHVAERVFRTWIFAAFGVLALVVATVGLYGVLSYAVSQQLREFGIRSALGADRAALVGLVVRDGTRLTLLGVGLGVMGALATSGWLSGVLYGVAPHDLATFAGVAVVIGTTAVAAMWLPARRAARVDPLVALRSE
ncbi:MAG: ABC transporter permease [Vicinamibacterales bacterium]